MNKKLKKLIISIKNNKLLTLLIVLIILVIILCIVAIKVLIFPSYSVDKYGDRLKGIESVQTNDERFSEIKNNFEEVDGFLIDRFRLSGKIVNIFVNVKDIDINTVKSNADKLVNSFNEDELDYYDFQVFIKVDGESSYYMIGYKNKNSEGLFWNYEGESSEEE